MRKGQAKHFSLRARIIFNKTTLEQKTGNKHSAEFSQPVLTKPGSKDLHFSVKKIMNGENSMSIMHKMLQLFYQRLKRL